MMTNTQIMNYLKFHRDHLFDLEMEYDKKQHDVYYRRVIEAIQEAELWISKACNRIRDVEEYEDGLMEMEAAK